MIAADDLRVFHALDRWSAAHFATPNDERLVQQSSILQILEQAATTTLEVNLVNPGRSQAEAVLLLPVPDGAAIHSFDFLGKSSEPTAQLLTKEEARRIYSSIVAKLRDPALLEFAGYNLVRTSVFPVPPATRLPTLTTGTSTR